MIISPETFGRSTGKFAPNGCMLASDELAVNYYQKCIYDMISAVLKSIDPVAMGIV